MVLPVDPHHRCGADPAAPGRCQGRGARRPPGGAGGGAVRVLHQWAGWGLPGEDPEADGFLNLDEDNLEKEAVGVIVGILVGSMVEVAGALKSTTLETFDARPGTSSWPPLGECWHLQAASCRTAPRSVRTASCKAGLNTTETHG